MSSEQLNRRIVIQKPGGPDALRLLEEPLPLPKDHEVRIRVRACGVAFGDSLIRQGAAPGTSYPVTPGYDIVGEVDTVGSAVTRFKAGDQVAGLPVLGGYTTFICLPERELVPVPIHLPPAEVVSVLLNYTTALRLLTKAARLKTGDSILVHGAAGGVGIAVLQIGKILGLRVYGTVSTKKMAVVEQQGGIPIDYTRTDFVAEIRRLTGNGVDAVLDPIGGNNLSRSYDALNERGTLVLFGVSSSLNGNGNPTLKTLKTMGRWLLLKLRFNARRVVTSFISTKNKGEGIYDDMAYVIQLLDAGTINPVIAKTFPLKKAGQAQAMLEQEKPIGKLVLLP